MGRSEQRVGTTRAQRPSQAFLKRAELFHTKIGKSSQPVKLELTLSPWDLSAVVLFPSHYRRSSSEWRNAVCIRTDSRNTAVSHSTLPKSAIPRPKVALTAAAVGGILLRPQSTGVTVRILRYGTAKKPGLAAIVGCERRTDNQMQLLPRPRLRWKENSGLDNARNATIRGPVGLFLRRRSCSFGNCHSAKSKDCCSPGIYTVLRCIPGRLRQHHCGGSRETLLAPPGHLLRG